MIQVCMLSEAGRLVGFTVQGHAGFTQEGGDIVCSAVSALAQTAVLGLKERLKLPLALRMEEGDLHCVLAKECTDAQVYEAGIVLDTLLLGLRSMELGYGEYLNIIEREV